MANLKFFNMRMNIATRMAITCCILHNFMWNVEWRFTNLKNRKETLIEFGAHMLHVHKEGETCHIWIQRPCFSLNMGY